MENEFDFVLINKFYYVLDPSGQILQLCDQINRQSTHSEQAVQVNNLPGPTSSGFVTNNAPSHNFNPNFQSGFQPSFQPAPQVQQQPQQPQQPQFAGMKFLDDCNIFDSINFFDICSASSFIPIEPALYLSTVYAATSVIRSKSICTAAVRWPRCE